MIEPAVALERLRAGNRRHVDRAHRSGRAASEHAGPGQQPYAVVLSCSDSRVAPEFAFDEGPGSLFVVRVAGNVAGPFELASIEFAVQSLETRLVVVLGHSECGAVGAALEHEREGTRPESPHLRALVDRVLPAVLQARSSEEDDVSVLETAVRSNIRRSTERLVADSEVLRQGTASGELSVVGAEYDLRDGSVVFFGQG